MGEGKWGVMTHYLADWKAQTDHLAINVDEWNRLINGFNLEALRINFSRRELPGIRSALARTRATVSRCDPLWPEAWGCRRRCDVERCTPASASHSPSSRIALQM